MDEAPNVSDDARKTLEREGWVVLPDLLSNEEVATLR